MIIRDEQEICNSNTSLSGQKLREFQSRRDLLNATSNTKVISRNLQNKHNDIIKSQAEFLSRQNKIFDQLQAKTKRSIDFMETEF